MVSLVQAYALPTGENPSGSATLPAQTSLSVVVALGDGVTETPVTVGFLLSTETDCDEVSVPPSPSVAVAVHTMVSLGLAILLVNCTVSVVPNMVDVVELLQE